MNPILLEKWKASWTIALNNWSRFTKLREPNFIFTPEERKKEGLDNVFAMIRLTDHTIFIDLEEIENRGLEEYSLEILGHEIGHHIAYPSNLTDMGRMIARIQKALTFPGLTQYSSFIGNIYTDLLINNKLFQDFGYKIHEVYQKLNTEKIDPFWLFYMRIYEILWALPKETLAIGEITPELEGDAQLGNRVIRSYANDWLRGAGKFAMLCIPYLMKENGSAKETQKILAPWLDAKSCNDKNITDFPDGLIEMDEDELSEILHPALDPDLNDGLSGDFNSIGKESNSPDESQISAIKKGQFREPFQYQQILKDMGINISAKDLAYRYYKERAMPHLIPFPQKKIPESMESILEGHDIWEVGSPIENINWFQTAMKSPIVIPGYTTLEDYYGTTVGQEPHREPIDLDIYVDCSGSMPNPSQQISYLALAGTIILLSALRVGSKVQATLWSGPKQFHTTKGFIDDERELMAIVTGYIGGSTAFPIHILRETYSKRKPSDRKVHILIISDDGVTTMYDKDEKRNDGYDIANMAIEKSGGGATMVLNLWTKIEKDKGLMRAQKQGWDIYPINAWESLVDFARAFSQRNYGDPR